MIKIIRQLFCKHSCEHYEYLGKINVGMNKLFVGVCQKCGKKLTRIV